MKTLLIVTYYFLPYNGIGAKRAFSFANYFADHDWGVIVLKAPDKAYGTNILVNRVKEKSGYETIDVDVDLKTKNKFLRRTISFYKYKSVISSLIQNRDIDVILFSGGPFFYFPLGSYFKNKFGTNYVLDYRDNEIGRINSTYKSRVYGFFFRHVYDRPAVKNADYIINVTNWNTNKHHFNNKDIEKLKFITVYNGYDDSKLLKFNDSVEGYKVDPRYFSIGIFGKFAYYNKQHVNLLLRTIRDLEGEGYRLRIYHIGEIETVFEKAASDLNLGNLVHFVGYVDYAEGMKILKRMNCFVLNNYMAGALGTKIFDYIFLNKPIIGMIKIPSQISMTLSAFENGYVTEDPKELKNIMRKIVSTKPGFLDEKINITKYARSYQIKKLAEKLSRLGPGRK